MKKKMIILGGGESGIGAALLAKQEGYDVFLSDGSSLKDVYKQELEANDIKYEHNGHTESIILAAEEIVKSPGIPEKNELMKKIRAKNISVISEIELAYRYKGDSKIIAITGSNGKTTTTSLIHHICKHAALDCAMVGNIGFSFARQVAKDPKPWYIVEISSFQLDDIKTFRPEVAVLTNITEDHLDRYDYNFENYIASKFRIIMNQTKGDFFIYNADDPVTIKYIKQYSIYANLLSFSMYEQTNHAGYVKDEQLFIDMHNEKMAMNIYDFWLSTGKHSRYNTMAAGLATSTIGLRKTKIKEAIETFETLTHRMEYVSTIRGIEFINDSKATNVNSTWFALESMKKPTILILGGVDKGNDYSPLIEMVKEKVKVIICMGIDNQKIHEQLGGYVKMMVDTESAIEAVKAAFAYGSKGDVVLLSPACASFDLFKNYEDRGDQFKEAVMEL